MGREVRRVPKDWVHPVDEKGRLIPMREKFPYIEEEIEEGLRDGWLVDEPPHYGVKLMPDWPKEERTHLQMYECTTEGTPISPVMETPEALAEWLANDEANAGASMTATYERWLGIIHAGSAPTMAIKVRIEKQKCRLCDLEKTTLLVPIASVHDGKHQLQPGQVLEEVMDPFSREIRSRIKVHVCKDCFNAVHRTWQQIVRPEL
jgi:hypothetical protein